jgi:baseplate J-like protein
MNNDACGCCEGVENVVPVAIENRPGLNTLRYRIGTHGSFLESLKARLSSSQYPSLQKLTTREAYDPSIAILDSWAMVADVLTFYQERIANEGYLRTATERRSILELARLIGYRLRPGVAASVYLAFTIENGFDVEIPKGTRAQSLPGPGELPQPFETSEALKARSVWNTLKPRMTRPQDITFENVLSFDNIYFEGTTTNLKANDRLLLVFGEEPTRQVIRSVQKVTAQSDENRTEVSLQPVPLIVIGIVAVLRSIISALKTTMQFYDYAVVDGMLDETYNQLNTLLENFLLGNYPPIDSSYFSHLRIYQFLSLFTEPTAKLREVGLTAREQFSDLFTPRSTSTRARADRSKQGTAPDQGKLLEDLQWTLLMAGLEMVAELLANEVFRKSLACLSSIVVEQAHPITPTEKQTVQVFLTSELVQQLKQLDNFLRWLNNQQQDPMQEKVRLKAWDILNRQLILLLHNADLHQNILIFLSDLLTLKQEPSESLPTGTKTARIFELLQQVRDWVASIQPDPRFGCAQEQEATSLRELILPLLKQPSLQPTNSVHLIRSAQEAFRLKADAIPQALVSLQPGLREYLYSAWGKASVTPIRAELKGVFALRLTVPLFGNNAPVKMALKKNQDTSTNTDLPYIAQPDGDWTTSEAEDESQQQIFLDNAYPAILPSSYVVIRRKNERRGPLMPADMRAFGVDSATVRPRKAYGLSTQTTQVALSRPWVSGEVEMADIRTTIVYAQSEPLPLAEAPYTAEIAGDEIELQALYNDLQSGRWLIISGERTDVPGTTGVQAKELVMLTAVTQSESATSIQTKSTLRLANKLAYTYKRDTVSIYANVVNATHGESLSETFGSGDGSQAFQQFGLRQTPLTYVSAPTPDGAESSLVARVNDVQWHEAISLAGLGNKDRGYITRIDDDGKTNIMFGDGKHGARLPTGIENIKGKYRRGIGKAGNVKAEQIKLLATKPLHVKGVVNPMRASGGADRDTRDQARRNAPLTVAALDRLVSVKDYADFARTFAGIGKANAVQLSDGRREVIHLTIAGLDDIPIDKSSDLYLNLRLALQKFGETFQPIVVELRALSLLVISAKIQVAADYAWEFVEPKIRLALLDVFSFERRELGQDVTSSEVLSAIQDVEGVSYIDLDVLDAVDEKRLKAFLDKNGESTDQNDPTKLVNHLNLTLNMRLNADLAHLDPQTNQVAPAQMAYLDPTLPDTLILTELQS